jgi:hypothetical protein
VLQRPTEPAIGFRDGHSVRNPIDVRWPGVTDVSDTRTGIVPSLSGPRNEAMTEATSRLSQTATW